MPTYEYECESCGHTFEKFQNMSDKPLSKCPKCDKTPRRLIGNGSGIIFKGSGFYATDYRKDKGKPGGGASCASPANPACAGCPSANQPEGRGLAS